MNISYIQGMRNASMYPYNIYKNEYTLNYPNVIDTSRIKYCGDQTANSDKIEWFNYQLGPGYPQNPGFYNCSKCCEQTFYERWLRQGR